jgi:hypothetical protein
VAVVRRMVVLVEIAGAFEAETVVDAQVADSIVAAVEIAADAGAVVVVRGVVLRHASLHSNFSSVTCSQV